MTKPNPYLIEGPALISFSGGRTSAYMLHEILRAYDGKLPADVHVAFANTGKERAETLRFVHECGSRWGVKVRWLEYRPGGKFEEVGYNSASRNGEPFEAIIAEKQFLPNAVTRFCTTKLKVEVMKKFMIEAGYQRWNNAIGLRYDEGLRVFKQLERNEQGKERWTTVMPMSKARATKRGHVMPFWFGPGVDRVPILIPSWDLLPQGFDLGLQDYEGNCDMCFLKAKGALKRIIRDVPEAAGWWVAQEQSVSPRKPSGARFVTEYSYETLEREVQLSPFMPGLLDDDFGDHDVECGLTCA